MENNKKHMSGNHTRIDAKNEVIPEHSPDFPVTDFNQSTHGEIVPETSEDNAEKAKKFVDRNHK